MAPEKQKAPAYQWFPKDAETDETFKLMTYEQQGVYRALLDHQWLEGSIPGDPKQIARLLPKVSPARFLKLWPGIAPCFLPCEDDRIANVKLEKQRDQLAVYIAQQKINGPKGADRRWARERARHGEPSRVATELPLAIHSSASASPTASAFTHTRHREVTLDDDADGERARVLLEELYPEWYTKFRHGAKLRLVHGWQNLDAAISIVKLWDDARIAKLAEIFLTTDETWISSTDRNFRLFASRASWCDDRLKQAELAQA